jgi:hypothetical protein
MWTAQIQEIRKDPSRPLAIVLFTDGVKYKREEAIDLTNMSAANFRARVDSLRKGFEDAFTFIDSLTVDFDLTPTALPTPTPDARGERRAGAQSEAVCAGPGPARLHDQTARSGRV